MTSVCRPVDTELPSTLTISYYRRQTNTDDIRRFRYSAPTALALHVVIRPVSCEYRCARGPLLPQRRSFIGLTSFFFFLLSGQIDLAVRPGFAPLTAVAVTGRRRHVCGRGARQRTYRRRFYFFSPPDLVNTVRGQLRRYCPRTMNKKHAGEVHDFSYGTVVPPPPARRVFIFNRPPSAKSRRRGTGRNQSGGGRGESIEIVRKRSGNRVGVRFQTSRRIYAIGVLHFGRKTNFPYRRKITKIPFQKDILIVGLDRENRPSGHIMTIFLRVESNVCKENTQPKVRTVDAICVTLGKSLGL